MSERLEEEPAKQSLEQGWRILNERDNDGLKVKLWWSEASGDLVVDVDDRRAEEAFTVPAAPDNAMEVFLHPHAFRGSGKLAVSQAYHEAA